MTFTSHSMLSLLCASAMGLGSIAGCATDDESVPDDDVLLFGDNGDGKADGAAVSCDLQGSLAGAAGVLVTGAALTAACGGVLAVTGPGEVLCVAPAAGTAFAALVAGVAGTGAFLSCQAQGGSQRRTLPLTQSTSQQCRLGTPQFCNNLVGKYKNYCGLDVFSRTSQISCEAIDLRPATATAAKCAEVKKKIELSTGCLVGRRMMFNFVEKGVCRGTPDDPNGDGHWAAIQRVNDTLAECKSKYRRACSGLTDQEIQNATAKDFARAVYQCR